MPHANCCVPYCVATSRRTPSLRFYQLPKSENRKKNWIKLVRNDNLRTQSKWTSVCSLHFAGGLKTYMINDPTIFPWSAEWPGVIETYNRKLESENTAEVATSSSNTKRINPLPLITPKHSKADRVTSKPSRKPPTTRGHHSKNTSHGVNTNVARGQQEPAVISGDESDEEAVDDVSILEGPEPSQVCEAHLQQQNASLLAPNKDTSLDAEGQDNATAFTSDEDEVTITENQDHPYYRSTHLLLKDDLQDLLDQIMSELTKDDSLNDVVTLKKFLKVTVQLLKNVKEEYEIVTELRDWDRFLLRRFQGSDEDIRFWTGFYSYAALMAFYRNMLEPNENKIKHWGAIYADTKNVSHDKGGPKRKLQPVDEMFLTLVKLKQGSANQDLADRFNISNRHVSRIFTTWVKFMHSALMSINCWMSHGKVREYMPTCFKELYRDVRVVIDCTEIPLQRPSDFECQSATYSNYKHCNTLKGLVGISPSGVPTFVSDLYEGSISDNQLAFECGLMKLCEKGGVILADRGFTCKETMAKLGIRLVIPHFLGGKDQLDLLQITESVAIARVRIHVERAMGRIKQWHILSRTLPVAYWNCANEIFQLCTKLVLFWPPLVGSE